MTYEQARNAIQAHFNANWTGTTSDKVAYDNLPFTPPSSAAWVRLSIQHLSGSQIGFGAGNARFRRLGQVVITIHTQENLGPSQAMQLGDTAVALFEGVKLASGLRFTEVSLSETGIEGGWYRAEMTASFEFDEVR